MNSTANPSLGNEPAPIERKNMRNSILEREGGNRTPLAIHIAHTANSARNRLFIPPSLLERFTLHAKQVSNQNAQLSDIAGDFYEKDATSWELNYAV